MGYPLCVHSTGSVILGLGALHPWHSLAPSSVSRTVALEEQPSPNSYTAPARLNRQTVTGKLEILGRDISGSITF